MDVDRERLELAVRVVAAGLTLIDPALPADEGVSVGAADVEALSARELDVLHLLARGLPNKGIAHRLGISEHTVKYHVSAILAKLNAESRTEAVAVAARLGLIAL